MKKDFLQLIMINPSMKVKIIGIIGALSGMMISAALWFFIKKMIPERFFKFITEGKSRKKGKDKKNA